MYFHINHCKLRVFDTPCRALNRPFKTHDSRTGLLISISFEKLPSFTSSDRSTQQHCLCARHRDGVHDHHILGTHVGVIQYVQPPACLQQRQSTVTLEHFRSDHLRHPNTGFPVDCMHVTSMHVSPSLQGVPCCNLHCVSASLISSGIRTWLTSDLATNHKRGHP